MFLNAARMEQFVKGRLSYFESILDSLKEPFLVLDKQLVVKSANRAYYETYQVSPKETESHSLSRVGEPAMGHPQATDLTGRSPTE